MTTPAIALRDGATSWTPTDTGGIIVLDLRTSRYLSLNAAGSTLWPLLAGGTTRAALQTALREAYELDDATAGRDVDAFLDGLRARDLLAG